jgi:hypothetical protein
VLPPSSQVVDEASSIRPRCDGHMYPACSHERAARAPEPPVQLGLLGEPGWPLRPPPLSQAASGWDERLNDDALDRSTACNVSSLVPNAPLAAGPTISSVHLPPRREAFASLVEGRVEGACEPISSSSSSKGPSGNSEAGRRVALSSSILHITCTRAVSTPPRLLNSSDSSSLAAASPSRAPTTSLEKDEPSRFPSLPGALDGSGPFLRPWLRSDLAYAEFETFDWPLTSLDEVARLLRCRALRPTWLMLGDASASWTRQMETTHGIIALVVDRRALEEPCLCYRGSFHDVLGLQLWDGVCAWPSCTHHAVSNGPLLKTKIADGRAFWGLVGVLYVLFAHSARVRLVEQPITILNRFYPWPTRRLRTAAFGDALDKTICLRLVGLSVLHLARHYAARPVEPIPRLPVWAFASAEERDAYRSSWAHFPLFVYALAACLTATPQPPPPSFGEAVEQLAVAWHKAGRQVPAGYDAPDGLPPSAEARAYQLEHGPGDGRVVVGVVPRSLLRSAPLSSIPSPPITRDEHLDGSLVRTTELDRLAIARCIALSALSAHGFMLFFMAVAAQPLVFAALNGVDVIGAELPLSSSPRSIALPIMEQWAETAWGVGTAATTFLIGCYEQGPRLGVAVLPIIPAEADVARTPRQLQLLRRTRAFAWCSLAALATLTVADPAARAFAGVEAFINPVARLADFTVGGEGAPSFRFGALGAVSLDPSPRLLLSRTPAAMMISQDATHALWLRHALVERAAGVRGELFEGWAERIGPPPIDLQAELAALMPDFSDDQLLLQPFSPAYQPPATTWLPRAPRQPSRQTPFCVRSPLQLLREPALARLHAWFGKILDQLLCIEREQPNCELLRPHAIAIGQHALWPWAQGIVWDFTFERADCAVPLDYSLPIESNLDLDILGHKLRYLPDGGAREYPDQRLLSFLLEGVRFEADVELQTVLVPHLISLPKGFASVRKELYRLHDKDWYRFFDHLPFWPIYVNGQGAAARKLSERYRRTTECGGPRKPTRDESGLLAISINDASVTNHFPVWFYSRLGEPLFDQWLAAKGILDPAVRGTPSSLPREVKPGLETVMQDLSVLSAAARLLDEPLYIFGDDAADHFNQLAVSSEDWNRLGVVFLHDEARVASSRPSDRLFFVSERRLGFGAKVSSNYAQRFSEAVLMLLREEMDALERAEPADRRPSARKHLAQRERVAERLFARSDGSVPKSSLRHQQARLYCVHMYTDDAIFAVVGVRRALRLLGAWQRLTADIQLKMAPPEKRSIGTWAPWLGVYLLAGLGLVVVPKEKLLRTVSRLRNVLTCAVEFSEYRSLMGMLEHLRCVNRAPASVMYGLYAPHRSPRIRLDGPSAIVSLTPFMEAQLNDWIALTVSSGGTVVTAVLERTESTAELHLHVVISSDAATDSSPPGIGGYCHGLYWYLEIKPEWLEWLHITVLELLATGGSALAFAPFVSAAQSVVLQSDALATPYVLAKHKSRSANLGFAHRALLDSPDYRDVAWLAKIAHLFGDCNPFADAISRALHARFAALCRAINVRPTLLPTPPVLVQIIERTVADAKARGQRVSIPTFHRTAPVLPAAMLALGRESPACEEADAVRQISEMLRRALCADAPEPPARPAAPRASTVSSSLLSALRPGADPANPPQHIHAPQAPRGARVIDDRLRRAICASQPSAPEPRPSASAASAPANNTAKPASGKRHVERAAMDSTTIAGIRLVAVPTSQARPPTESKRRKTDALKSAAHACAATRAQSLARAGFANTAYGLEQLTRLLTHAVDLNDFGAAHSTRSVNELAWQHWTAFAEVLGFEPIFTAEQVRDHQSHIGTLLATFLLFVYPKMKGKNGRQWAKPRSAFAYVLAVIRIFREWKLILPPAKVVKGELHGLLRAFVNVHGVHALMPRRKEPFTFAMITAMQNVDAARLGARSYRADSAIGRALRGILAVGWRTGHRLAEFVSHPSGELTYLTRGSITYVINGVSVSDPNRAQLLQMRPGDVILIEPPRSKTDQFGEIHCPFPSTVPFNLKPHSAGHVLRQLELDDPCRGADRTSTPLFADEAGRPYTHAVMDTLLDHMLVHSFGGAAKARFSWHSMRIGLATALKAANVDDDVIQMICRWTNPESLRAYARHGQSLHINSVDMAEHAVIDAIQSANVPKVCNTEGNAALNLAFAPTISARAQAVLDAADDAILAAAPTPTRTARPALPLVAADLRPLDADSVGRRVLIPAHAWPNYPCDEHNGQGWAGMIIAISRNAATVRFTEATTARGLPYENARLQMAILRPI